MGDFDEEDDGELDDDAEELGEAFETISEATEHYLGGDETDGLDFNGDPLDIDDEAAEFAFEGDPFADDVIDEDEIAAEFAFEGDPFADDADLEPFDIRTVFEDDGTLRGPFPNYEEALHYANELNFAHHRVIYDAEADVFYVEIIDSDRSTI